MAPRFLPISFLVLFLPIVTWCQPKLNIVGGTRFDFGEIYNSIPVKRQLTIRNDGRDTLKVWDVSGSCGCTGTLLSSDNILPGKSGTLEITFDPTSFSGIVEKAVSMKTNDTAQAKVKIFFTADVRKVLELYPNYIVFKARVDSATTDTIIVVNVSKGPINLTSLKSSDQHLTLQPRQTQIDAGERTEIICRYTPKSAGTARGDITIATDNPHLASVNVRFFSLVRTASPASKSN